MKRQKLNFEEIRRKLQAIIGERPKNSFRDLAQSTLVREPGDHCDFTSTVGQKEADTFVANNHWLKLVQARNALDCIRDGTYGTCLACDEPIAPKRLDAVPWARFCVECQDKFDHRELVGFEHLAPVRQPMRTNFAVR